MHTCGWLLARSRLHGALHHAPPDTCTVLLHCEEGMDAEVACLLAGWLHWYNRMPLQVRKPEGGHVRCMPLASASCYARVYPCIMCMMHLMLPLGVQGASASGGHFMSCNLHAAASDDWLRCTTHAEMR